MAAIAGLSDYAEEKILEHFFNAASPYTSPTSLYVALYTTPPEDTGLSAVEVSAGGYARQALSLGSYASRQLVSNASMTWAATANWGTITHFAILDASTGGNILAGGPLQPNPTILSGQSYTLAVGEVIISIPIDYPIGSWLVQRILEKIFKNTSHATIASSVYAHLVTVLPTGYDTGTGGTYLVATGYASIAVAFAAWAAGRCLLSADGVISASAGAAWGTIPGYVLRDNAASGSGNFLFVGAFSPVPTIAAGVPVTLDAANTYIGLN